MKKNTIIAIIVSVIAFALLIPVAVGTGAAEIFGLLSGSSFSSFSFITFFNARNDETSLYIRKTVTTADDSVEAPSNDEFEFTIELNGELAVKTSYLLFNKDGKQIYNYGDGPTTEERTDAFPIEWKTDETGAFILKDGETAKFDNLSAGTSYKIVEAKRLNYISSSTEDGISGTLLPEGTRVDFKNLYASGKPGTLEVRKKISFPEGYELPDMPEFSFLIKIGGKPFAGKECEIKDGVTDNVIGTGSTDSNGILKLSGNTYAIFQDIPEDVDYSVEEILTDEMTSNGWRISGDLKQEGATEPAGGTIASFTNVQAGFIVSKAIFGGAASDEIFDFQVIDQNEQAFGKSLYYYLYDGNLHLIKDEDHPDGVYYTGTDGTFTMKANQRAVFFAIQDEVEGETKIIGIEKGTQYGVREISSGRYIQYLPTLANGYTDKVVEDSVEVLPFINAYIPSETLLTVKKTLEDQSDNASAPDVEFVFRISKLTGQDEQGNDIYEPAVNVDYDIATGPGAGEYRTDSNGYFKLRAWEIARFTKLKRGDTYKVEEVLSELPAGFEAASTEPKTGTLEEVLEMEFHNTYDVDQPSASILKVTQSGTPLAGAALELWTEDQWRSHQRAIAVGEGTAIEDTSTPIHRWTSNVTAEELKLNPGTYYIVETEAPQGYKVSEARKITIKDASELQSFTFTNEPNQEIPTGLAFLKQPLVRILLVLIAVLGALVAVYFGVIKRKKKSE